MMSEPSHVKQSLAEVFVANRAALSAIACKIVAQRDYVEDVLQDAYIKIAEGVVAREVRNPLGYCCQVVRNAAFDVYRRGVVESGCFVVLRDGELPETEGAMPPEAGIDERKLLIEVEAALVTLPTRTRQVFELYRLNGLTQREIGKKLGVSATLVNFMIKDAMMALAGCKKAFEA